MCIRVIMLNMVISTRVLRSVLLTKQYNKQQITYNKKNACLSQTDCAAAGAVGGIGLCFVGI